MFLLAQKYPEKQWISSELQFDETGPLHVKFYPKIGHVVKVSVYVIVNIHTSL